MASFTEIDLVVSEEKESAMINDISLHLQFSKMKVNDLKNLIKALSLLKNKKASSKKYLC